ncbi:unnamed protein product [Miscanthus lutarioriparius]|uniref:KIB1-4 beta-propeller domain-containing protein n=1 Tax=Miscanthus lutarioriparius TaxID=422564 RepID=A0A811SB52_9POAL|nr:unnamed protein product [Miscanthus lutarioriparius]
MGSSSHERGSASWSELPADVLVTVLEGLAIRDLCRWWNAASSCVRAQHSALSRPGTPCLLYMAAAASPSDPPAAAASSTLFSVTDGRPYSVPLAAGASIREGFWLGASHGWLVTVDDHAEPHLVNPVTGQRIDTLPSVATVEQVRRVHDEGGAVVADTYTVYQYDSSLWVYDPANAATTLDARELIDYLYVRAIISSDPSDGDCVVVLVYWLDYQLCFARPGDAHWTWIRPPTENTQYCDCAFDGDGRTLYAMRHDGAIHAFDLLGRPALEREVVLRSQVQGGRTATNYLVHAPWLRGASGWLQVWRRMGATEPVTPAAVAQESAWRTESITVYQVDLAAQTLVEIKNLGDHALFVGCNYSFALAATDCPGVLPNHVYYTDNEEHYALYSPQCPRDIGIYNVGDGSFHQVQPPCPWLNWPLPTWIMPSPCYKG